MENTLQAQTLRNHTPHETILSTKNLITEYDDDSNNNLKPTRRTGLHNTFSNACSTLESTHNDYTTPPRAQLPQPTLIVSIDERFEQQNSSLDSLRRMIENQNVEIKLIKDNQLKSLSDSHNNKEKCRCEVKRLEKSFRQEIENLRGAMKLVQGDENLQSETASKNKPFKQSKSRFETGVEVGSLRQETQTLKEHIVLQTLKEDIVLLESEMSKYANDLSVNNKALDGQGCEISRLVEAQEMLKKTSESTKSRVEYISEELRKVNIVIQRLHEDAQQKSKRAVRRGTAMYEEEEDEERVAGGRSSMSSLLDSFEVSSISGGSDVDVDEDSCSKEFTGHYSSDYENDSFEESENNHYSSFLDDVHVHDDDDDAGDHIDSFLDTGFGMRDIGGGISLRDCETDDESCQNVFDFDVVDDVDVDVFPVRHSSSSFLNKLTLLDLEGD